MKTPFEGPGAFKTSLAPLQCWGVVGVEVRLNDRGDILPTDRKSIRRAHGTMFVCRPCTEVEPILASSRYDGMSLF